MKQLKGCAGSHPKALIYHRHFINKFHKEEKIPLTQNVATSVSSPFSIKNESQL